MVKHAEPNLRLKAAGLFKYDLLADTSRWSANNASEIISLQKCPLREAAVIRDLKIYFVAGEC